MPAIETNGLTKQFGTVTAVDDLDLVVESGEVFGFLGPNGAGKSTTIDLLLGFCRPSAGDATVVGHDVSEEPFAVRARTGLLPEGFELYEHLTGYEHLRSTIAANDADEDPDALLERVGLDPGEACRRVGGYSKGMTQRLALALALVGEPDLLVLDEPSSGLDPEGIKRLQRIVRAEVERGATVFFSSHVLAHVEQVCDRVGIMADGELVAVDDVDRLRAQLDAPVVVEATVDDPPAPDAVASIDGVDDVTVEGNVVRASCTREPAKMAVLDRLNDVATVRDFDTSDVSLETVFEAYTDRTADASRVDGDGATAAGTDGMAPASGGERR